MCPTWDIQPRCDKRNKLFSQLSLFKLADCPSSDLPSAEEANFLPSHLLFKLRRGAVHREEPFN